MSYAPIEALACDGRLTLLSGTPVPTTDQTAKTTVYFTPFRGNRIAVYDGASLWLLRTFSELSVAVPATTNTNFDVFAYDNAGAVALETVNWTNGTTRATALTTQNGVLVKSGATTRRYLGTGRTTGTSGQCQDSRGEGHQAGGRRFLWNYYNRVLLQAGVKDTTDSWTYTTATWRNANGSAANEVEIVVGWIEDYVRAVVHAMANTTVAAVVAVGIRTDATNLNQAMLVGAPISGYGEVTAVYLGHLLGYHPIGWLEISQAVGTTSWYGDSGVTYYQSGLHAEVWG